MSRRGLTRLAAVAAAVVVAGVVPGTVGSTAGASTVASGADHSTRATKCLRTVGSGSGTGLDRAADTSEFTQAQVARQERQLHARLDARGVSARSARVAAPTIRIPVHVHVIAGTSSPYLTKDRVLQQMKVLNGGYDGAESVDNTPTRFAFYLASLDRTTNNKWRTANPGGPVDHAMRRTLHIGGRQDLNLYIASPVDPSLGGSTVLGFSTLPWNEASHPYIDGVTVAQGSLPGGALKGFNLGDTAVHEVGHWLGLYHTFQGGCSKTNDEVADTPEEASPSSGCNTARNTCAAPGNDPVHNFMDYSPDPCMNQFTPGQVTRMTEEWLAYRTP